MDLNLLSLRINTTQVHQKDSENIRAQIALSISMFLSKLTEQKIKCCVCKEPLSNEKIKWTFAMSGSDFCCDICDELP